MSDIVEWLRNSNSDEWCSGQLLKAADEIERMKREATIRIDQIKREQEAHLRTIADYNRARVEAEKLRERLAEADEANRRVSDENEQLRKDLKTAIMGDSAELQDVKRENETLCEALKAVFNGVIQENEGLDWAIINRAALRAAAAAIRESK